MDRQFIEYYEKELLHLREMGAEFAAANPIIAKQLAIDEFGVQDPYVERLLEGFAFMAARIQLKMDAQFPRFTEAMLASVFPHLLAPTPSMTIVQFQPELADGSIAAGFPIPRGTVLRSRGLHRTAATSLCEFRTAHPVTLYPLRVAEVQYHARDMGVLGLPPGLKAKAALRFRIQTSTFKPISSLNLSELTVYFGGSSGLNTKLYELVFGRAMQLVVQPATRPVKTQWVLEDWRQPVGFDDADAMLPFNAQSFQGYRLLKEYFSLYQRYLFLKIGKLDKAVQSCESDSLDIIITLNSQEPQLEGLVSLENIALFCAPAVNLFPREADRIQINPQQFEFPVIVDRNRARDYEVYDVKSVTGFGASQLERQEFAPFYAAHDVNSGGSGRGAYFSTHRIPRALSEREQRMGRRSAYLGSEVWLSLVDAKNAPFRTDLRQLGVSVLCTNRDLPEHLQLNPRDESAFSWEMGGPIKAVRCMVPPTQPRESWGASDRSWRLINHLGLNYLSLCDNDEKQGAAALREMLALYGDTGDKPQRHQIDGVRRIFARPVSRRVPAPGPIVFARGLEVNLLMDEAMFEGVGVFLLGAVLERFFARYVSMNTFTETVLTTLERGEVMRWPPTLGKRNLL